ncbi:MAG: hypothetical protein ACR2P6_07880 [Gammaproteobacteria bacterium]
MSSVNDTDNAIAGASNDVSDVGDWDPYVVSVVESSSLPRAERRVRQELINPGRRHNDPRDGHDSTRRRASLLRTGG